MEQETLAEKTETKVRRLGRWQYSLRGLLLLVTVIALVVAGWKTYDYYYLKWYYPYGYSHLCDIQLMFSLQRYANNHGGKYPTGEATPEASLCLLYPKYESAYMLRGKTVPLEVAERLLGQGKPLGPTTCDWHYVDEGLTINDDPRIGLLWDKVGLGHNGERLPKGGHRVIFVNGTIQYIPGKHWDDFLKLQKILLLEKKGDPAAKSMKKPKHEWIYGFEED